MADSGDFHKFSAENVPSSEDKSAVSLSVSSDEYNSNPRSQTGIACSNGNPQESLLVESNLSLSSLKQADKRLPEQKRDSVSSNTRSPSVREATAVQHVGPESSLTVSEDVDTTLSKEVIMPQLSTNDAEVGSLNLLSSEWTKSTTVGVIPKASNTSQAVSATSSNTADAMMDRSNNSGQPLQQQHVPASDPPTKPADVSTAAPLSTAPAAAKCIKIVPASSVASLRSKVPPDLNVLAQIEPQSDGSEVILPLGVFDRQQTMLPVDEAIRKFAGFNQESAALAGVVSSDIAVVAVQPNSTLNDSTAVLPSTSTAVTTPPGSVVFMPAGGFIMTPPIPQHQPENESGSVSNGALSAKIGTVPEKPVQNKRAGGIFRVKPKAENLSESGATDVDSGGTPDSLDLLNKSRLKPSKTRPVTQRGLASTSASAAKSVLPMLKPSPQLVTLSSGPVFGPRTNNSKANSNSARAHPSNLFLLTKPRDKNLLRTTNVDKSESQPSSPASQNVLFKFTLPKSATERLRELQRISQLTSATKAERDTAKTEMDEILDKHRHGATTVYESEDISEEKGTAGTPPLEADSSLAAAKAVPTKPAAKKIVASRKPVGKQSTSSEKFAGDLDDAAALHDDSVDAGPPAVTTSTRPPFLLKKPVVVSKPGARTVGQIVAAQQSVRHYDAVTSSKPVADASGTNAPAASSDASSTATTKQRPAALRAKALFEMSAARSPSTSNVVLPVKVEPAEAVFPATTATPERQTYTTIRPKRARNPPVKPKTPAQPTAGTLSRAGKNASSSNLSGIVKLENSLHLTPAKPTHDVFSPRSDADSQAVSEETRSYIPTPVMDDGDGVTGLVIDDDLSQSAISTRLRRRKPANSATPTEPDDSDEATQYAEKILEDDAEFEKFFRELDEHLNDEFGADSGIVDDYYEHVSARVDVECQLDQWTVKIMSPPPAAVTRSRNVVDKNDIFGPLEGDDNDDDDSNNYYETQLVRKNPLDQTTIDEECDNLFDDTTGKQPSPQTRKQKAARLSRMRSRPDQAVERFIDRDISRLEQHLADLPTWEDCGEPPEEVLMRFHLLQEGSCVRWARVRGHVLPLPYKLPFDVAESELRRQDGIFETVSRDLIARKQHLVEAGRAMMLNDQLKKHLYGPLEEHCILLRGLADLDELEVQNIRQQQYYVQTALYNAYGPYVASYTPEMYAAAVASLVDVGPAARPEDVKHYFDWFEAQDRQLQASTASTSAAATTASDTFQHGTSFPSDDLNTMATPSNNTVLSPRPEVLSTLPQLGITFASISSQSSSYTDAVSSVTYSDSIFHRTISAAPAETQSSCVPPPVVPESFRYAEDQPFAADDIFGQSSDAPQPLEKQGSIEEDLPSTPPPPILERMAETPTSLTMSPTKSLSTGPPVTAGSKVLEFDVMSSYYDRTGSNSETTRQNTLSSASSGTGGRESREQLSSSYYREPIFDAASIFGDDSDAVLRKRSASGSRSSSARRQSIHAGYADEKKTKQRYADDESEDLSLPELEVQHVQESSKPRSKRRRHDSTASRKRGAPRRGSSQNELLDNSGSDDEGEVKSRSQSPMSSDEPPPPELSQPRESTPPPTRFKLTLKRAPLVSDASISSRTRNRRSAGTGAGTTRTDDVSAAVKAGDWCVAVVAAATSTSNERTAATKPSPSTASSSSTPDKSERRKRRRQRLNLREEEEESRLRRNNSDLAIQQPQTRYGTRLAAKTIAQSEAKLQRKDRNRRGRRRRRRHRTGSGSTDAEDKRRNDRSRKNSGKEDHESEANDTKSDKSSSEGEADNGAATPPPLLEPMFGGAMEETPVIRPKTARHVASTSAPKHPSGAQGRTSTNDAVGPSWLDSVFDDSSGRISSSARHHPHPIRHQSGDNLLRSSTDNTAHPAPMGGTSSRLDTGDDDAVFEDFLDSEFDLSTFLSGNDMHNVLIATSNSMTPTLGGGGITTLAHQHHHPHYTTDTPTAPPSSVMISQGNVFATQSTQFVPIRQDSENIPRDAGPPQIFRYASHSTVSREARIVPRPVLSILPGSGVGLGHVMVPPVLPTSILTTTAVHPSVATPPPPPLSTTNLDVIF